MSAATCNICVESFNKTTRREVKCNQCDMSACRGCQARYILGSVNDPHCMGCKVPWNSEFIIANFTKKFFTEDLAAHRANAIFEREKALMPDTQARIRRIQLAEEIVALGRIQEMYIRMNRVGDAAVYRERIHELRAEFGENDIASTSSRRGVVRPVCGCIREDCRGFVMNNNWKCGMCATKVCSDCLKENEEGHECKEEDRETRKMLLKDTKPCPKCGVMISKTEGCSQMWCIMCHTTFDWKTCEIVNGGYIHNPHYFEWARRNGREIARAPGDVPPGAPQCDQGLPDPGSFTNMIRRTYANENARLLLHVYRLTTHMTEVTLPQLREGRHDVLDDLRMKFLQGNIDEQRYKADLIKHERKQERNTAERHIVELYTTHMTELLRTIYNTRPRHLFTPEFKANMELADYCNSEFRRVARAYKGSRCFYIDQTIGHIVTRDA